MLVLTRNLRERFVIGDGIEITVVRVRAGSVSLAVQYRDEVEDLHVQSRRHVAAKPKGRSSARRHRRVVAY